MRIILAIGIIALTGCSTLNVVKGFDRTIKWLPPDNVDQSSYADLKYEFYSVEVDSEGNPIRELKHLGSAVGSVNSTAIHLPYLPIRVAMRATLSTCDCESEFSNVRTFR